jgi:ribosomal protein S18 acetylase RimI-like enzyme
MGGLTVRDAVAPDRPFIQRMLYEAANKPGEEWPPFEASINEARNVRHWRDWMRPGDVGVVAEQDGEPVGAAWVRQFGRGELGPLDDPSTPVLAIAVESDHRGQGVGKMLMSALMSRAAASGFQAVDLPTGTFNQAGLRLYEGAGFVETARIGDTVRMRATHTSTTK